MQSSKQPATFALLFLVTALFFRAAAVYRTELDISVWHLLVSCIEIGIVAGVGFYFGQLKSASVLTVTQLALCALFAYLLSHTLSNLVRLYDLSWFAYAASVVVISAIAAYRAPKLFAGKLATDSQN